MQYDWQELTSLAYLSLLEQNKRYFPLRASDITCIGIRIISYQEYAHKTGRSIQELSLNHELDDAFVLKGLRPGLTLILFDAEKQSARMQHTIWHEIGHIKLNHSKHGPKEEIEAHYFAAQANAPNAIIRVIAARGYKIDVPFLIKCFGMSCEAANKKMSYLRKYGFNHTNDYDDSLVAHYFDFINTNYPDRLGYSEDLYFEELEVERNNWI